MRRWGALFLENGLWCWVWGCGHYKGFKFLSASILSVPVKTPEKMFLSNGKLFEKKNVRM